MLLRSLLLFPLLAISTLPAQQLPTAARQQSRRAVDLRNTYHRLIAVVPLVGSGSRTDPRRPAYVPLSTAAPAKGAARTGIIAWQHQLSDDKKFALVEFVATDRSAFTAILADRSVTAFEKGKARGADIELELKKFKKDFDLSKLGVVVP
jgi:hypothetical protein